MQRVPTLLFILPMAAIIATGCDDHPAGPIENPTQGNLFRMTEGEARPLLPPITPGDAFTLLERTDDATLLAGTGNRIWRSTDNGEHWSPAPIESGRDGRGDYDPTALSRLGGDTLLLGTAGAGLHRSTDGGRNWSRFALPGRMVGGLSVDGDVIHVVGRYYTQGSPSFYLSTDRGRTWDSSSLGGLGTPTAYHRTLNGSFIVASTDRGILRSRDGRSWRLAGGVDGTVLDIAQLEDGSLVAGTMQGKVYRSSDDGMSWSVVNLGTRAPVTSIAVGTDGLYCAVAGEGVLRSTDGGGTWSRFARLVEDINIVEVIAPGTVLAGTTAPLN